MKKYPFNENPDLVDNIAEELSMDPVLKRFFIDYDIPNHTIVTHLNDLMLFKQEHPRCLSCEGLHVCTQDTLGHQPILTYKDEVITLSYRECNFLKNKQKKDKEKSRVNAMYMPQMIHQASLSDFHLDSPVRKEIYQKIMSIISKVKLDQEVKGLFISGNYQIGKTYTLAAIANHFATMNKTVVIAYYPDLVREIKSSIQKGNLEEIIHNLKTTDVLMLDDIGGESPSQWVRDEVLGPILQHRLLDKKLTFFSSNVGMKELPKYMVENTQDAEKLKSYRIFARINSLSDEVKM
ncbi:primosomal protein DnaI [Liberiplasma polymorphum]|uniref:primosomal protein DnaI n=1 Tax=Liberiplasma polymorphum TaxID=3374570 RepID=UPI003771F7C1